MSVSNFEFLANKYPQDFKLALRLESFVTQEEFDVAAPLLRHFLEAFLSPYCLPGTKELWRKIRQQERPNWFPKKCKDRLNQLTHGDGPPLTKDEAVELLKTIHHYMCNFQKNNRDIFTNVTPWDDTIYYPKLTENVKGKAQENPNKNSKESKGKAHVKVSVRYKAPNTENPRARAFLDLQSSTQLPELANFFKGEEFTDKLNEEVESYLSGIDKDYEENYPHKEEERNLNYYDGLEPQKYIQEMLEDNRAQKFVPEDTLKVFTKKLNELKKEYSDEIPEIEAAALKKYIHSEWQKKYYSERNKWLQDRIDQAREKFLAQLQKWMEQFKKLKQLLEPLGFGFGRLWDMSKGTLKNIDFKILEKYEAILAREQSLQELVDLLGRYRKSEVEYEKRLVQLVRYKSIFKVQNAPHGHPFSLSYGNDLSKVVPKEFAYLADEDTEILFYLKFARKQLLQYETVEKITDTVEEKYEQEEQASKDKDQGPFILCVDTSGSMHGLPEETAKLITYVIAKYAIAQKRKLFLINFSTSIECKDLSDIGESLPQLIEFLTMSFGGGTDITPAMREGLRVMATDNFRKADLLLISDGLFPSLDKSDLDLVAAQKEKESKFYSLMIGSSYMPESIAIFDKNWQFNQGDSYEKLVEQIRFSMGLSTISEAEQNSPPIS